MKNFINTSDDYPNTNYLNKTMLTRHFFILLITLLTQGIALADHDSYHRCKYSIPGYVTNQFVDNLDGSVTDSVTGLIWQRCNLGANWNQEAQACVGYPQYADWKSTLQSVVLYNEEQFAQGLASDWRLPNIKELASILNIHCVYPSINIEAFPGETSAYWSSTPAYSGTVETSIGETLVQEYAAWSINFYVNAKETRQGISQHLAARLVRQAIP
ncbi:MAG: DUF1566 domain-containing protein [Gammaproteobacteria bacterium]|nr:DUF1566 domain-containing protein [Gammaproteobacteria bacterium]